MNTTITINQSNYVVNEATLKTVAELIAKNKICENCSNSYTDQSFEVCRNLCLTCLLAKNPGFHYVGSYMIGDNTEAQEAQIKYRFTDQRGYIATTSPRYEYQDGLHTSVIETLNYYGFSFPKSVVYKGQEKQLYQEWYIVGDPAKDEILLISNGFSYFNKDNKYLTKRIEYLTIKHNGHAELNKKLGVVRKAMTATRIMYEMKGERVSEYEMMRETLKLLEPKLDLYR